MITLIDTCLLRQSELTRTLAGCAAIDPVGVFPMLDKIDYNDLTDERARIYLMQLRGRLPELQDASDERRAEIVVETAFSNNFHIDYLDWLLATENGITAEEQAAGCIQKLMVLALMQGGLEDLQAFAAQVVRDHGWGNAEARERAAREIHE